MSLLIAQWGSAEFGRGAFNAPAYGVVLRDDAGWHNDSNDLIELPQGAYEVIFSGLCMENLSAVTNAVQAHIATQDYIGGGVVPTRHRSYGAAGVLKPAFTVSGKILIDPPGETEIVTLITALQYGNGVDVDWAFEVSVESL